MFSLFICKRTHVSGANSITLSSFSLTTPTPIASYTHLSSFMYMEGIKKAEVVNYVLTQCRLREHMIID